MDRCNQFTEIVLATYSILSNAVVSPAGVLSTMELYITTSSAM